jgi:hypothetical protein
LITKLLLVIIGLVGLLLSACGPSQVEFDVTVTSIAAGIFATQTAQAPTPTETFTPSPTASLTPTPTATFTPTPTPSPTLDLLILFFDDFTATDSGWGEFSDADGGMGYNDGGYHLTINTTDSYYWAAAARYYTNVSIEVDAKKIKGPLNNEIGLICRMQDDSNFYLFSISSDGYYGIFKLIKDEWFNLGDLEWGFDNRVINTGIQFNHIKAICNDENLVLEVNGHVLMDIYDPDLTAGDVGIYAGTYEAGGLEVRFDNFLVAKP